MKKIILLIPILFTLCVTKVKAQRETEVTINEAFNAYFSVFDQIESPSGFLLNRGFIDPNYLEELRIVRNNNHVDYVITNSLRWNILYEKLRNSDVRLPILDSVASFWNLRNEDQSIGNTISFGIINIDGDYLTPSVVERYYNINTEKIDNNAPLETVRIFSVSHFKSSVHSANVTFTFNRSLYFSNVSDTVLGLEIDFDDGGGYQNFSFGDINHSVSYDSEGKKSIRYNLNPI